MFQIIDRECNFSVIKSGFHTAAQANNWAKKHLPREEVQLWGAKWTGWKYYRYFVKMK